MQAGVSIYSLRLVKESSVEYESKKVTNTHNLFNLIEDAFDLSHRPEETLVLICASTTLQPAALFVVSQGTVDKAQVSVADILKRVILSNSTRFFIAHNHPAGSLRPSNEDLKLTHRLKEAAKLLELDFVDHLIVSHGRFISLVENGDFN